MPRYTFEMSTTPISNGRPPLLPVIGNVIGSQSPSVIINQKKTPAFNRGSTPQKRDLGTVDAHSSKRAPSLNSGVNYESSNAERRKNKKQKMIPGNKRVSFGGNSIKFIPQLSSEQNLNPCADNHDTPSIGVRDTPPISRPRLDMLPGVNDDSDMDTLSVTRAPSCPSESPSRFQSLLPTFQSPRNRQSFTRHSERQSFGLFVDEDVTMASRDMGFDLADEDTDHQPSPLGHSSFENPRASQDIGLDAIDDDTTQQLSRLGPSNLTYRPSEPEDGDITYAVGSGFFDFLKAASKDKQYVSEKTPCSTEPKSLQASSLNRTLETSVGNEDRTKLTGASPAMDKLNNESFFVLEAGDEAASVRDRDNSLPTLETLERNREDSFDDKENLPEEQDAVVEPPGKENVETQGSFELKNSSRLPNSMRPVEPDRRKLFDSEEVDDEETIHFHDQVRENQEVSKGSGQTPDPALKSLTSTPDRSISSLRKALAPANEVCDAGAPQSHGKLKKFNESFHALEDPQPGEGREPVAQYQGLLNSVMIGANPQPVSVDKGIPESEELKLDQLLRALGLNFDNPVRAPIRGGSLAPPESSPVKFQPSSPEYEIYELSRTKCFLERIQDEKRKLKLSVNSVAEAVQGLEQEMESLQPPMVQMLKKYKDATIEQSSALHSAMRRLRNKSITEARQEWVISRKKWEGEIHADMVQICIALEKDSVVVRNKRAGILATSSQFASLEQKFDIDVEDHIEGMNSKDVQIARRLLFRDTSFVRAMREYMTTQDLENMDMEKKKLFLEPLESQLSLECDEMEYYAGKDHGILKKMIAEKHELLSIVAGVTGIRISKLNKNSISLSICGLVRIHFSLHEDKVINTSCKPVKLSQGEGQSVLDSLVDSAVSVTGSVAELKNVKLVRNITSVLRGFSYSMMVTRFILEEACKYFDGHIGHLTAASETELNGSPALRIAACASFYSLGMKSKFDVLISLTTYSVTPDSKEIREIVVVEEIRRTIGNTPEDEHIRQAVVKGGNKSSLAFSMKDAFDAVWELLS